MNVDDMQTDYGTQTTSKLVVKASGEAFFYERHGKSTQMLV